MAHTESTIFHHLLQCLTWSLDPYELLFSYPYSVPFYNLFYLQSVYTVQSKNRPSTYPNFLLKWYEHWFWETTVSSSMNLVDISGNFGELQPFFNSNCQWWTCLLIIFSALFIIKNSCIPLQNILTTHCFNTIDGLNNFQCLCNTFTQFKIKLNVVRLLHCSFPEQASQGTVNCYVITNEPVMPRLRYFYRR